jgi:hypothetical protein
MQKHREDLLGESYEKYTQWKGDKAEYNYLLVYFLFLKIKYLQ